MKWQEYEEATMNKTGHAARWGGAIGFLVGGPLAFTVVTIAYSHSDNVDVANYAWMYGIGFGLLGSIFGAVIGAIIGAVIGAVVDHRKEK